jgi:hypothetical protein
MAMDRDEGERVPMAAVALGASGLVLPVVAIIARLSAGTPPDTPLPAFLMLMAFMSASLILSFLGGIWWGVAIGRTETEGAGPGGLLALAIVPTVVTLLIAGLSGWMPKTGAVLLGTAIIATLLVDRGLAMRGLVPVWWMRLRVPLSLALGLLTAGLALLM